MKKFVLSSVFALLMIFSLNTDAHAEEFCALGSYPAGEEISAYIALVSNEATVSAEGLPSEFWIRESPGDHGKHLSLEGKSMAAGELNFSIIVSEAPGKINCNASFEPALPQISIPGDFSCAIGDSIEMHVSAHVSDGGTLSYQWYSGAGLAGSAISGATGSSYFPDTSHPGQQSYFCEVTNTNNSYTSTALSDVMFVSVAEPRITGIEVESLPETLVYAPGDTLDTNGLHWAEVLWRQYEAIGLPVSKADFREAYVHGERTMGRQSLVHPTDDFRQVLLIKSRLQLRYLVDKGLLDTDVYHLEPYAEQIADGGYQVARAVTQSARKVLQMLKTKYKLVLVSNFYGNIRTILEDFNLLCLFEEVVESSVVGVRKPDPAIFALGVEALGLPPEQVAVVGDSYTKDILPAHSLGCRTVWLKGIGWETEEYDESLPSAVIGTLEEVTEVVERLL